MKVRHVYNCRWLWVDGMVVYPFILFRERLPLVPPCLERHERYHVFQIRRDGYIGFHLGYAWQHLRGLFRHRSWHRAYWLNPYEIEARSAGGC